MEDLRGMLILSKSDEGMAELLDKARMYYMLKKPAKEPENVGSGTYYAPYIPVSMSLPLFKSSPKEPNTLQKLWNKITSSKK